MVQYQRWFYFGLSLCRHESGTPLQAILSAQRGHCGDKIRLLLIVVFLEH